MSILDFCGVFKCLDEKNNCFIINQIVTDIISLLYSVYKACHHFKLFKEQKIPKQKQKEFIDQVGFCDQNKEEHFRKIVERYNKKVNLSKQIVIPELKCIDKSIKLKDLSKHLQANENNFGFNELIFFNTKQYSLIVKSPEKVKIKNDTETKDISLFYLFIQKMDDDDRMQLGNNIIVNQIQINSKKLSDIANELHDNAVELIMKNTKKIE